MANNLFTSMMLQLHSQSAHKAEMEKELQAVRRQLAKADKILKQKDLLIGSLESDLAHLVELLVNSDYNKNHDCSKQWIYRSVPGFNQDQELTN